MKDFILYDRMKFFDVFTINEAYDLLGELEWLADSLQNFIASMKQTHGDFDDEMIIAKLQHFAVYISNVCKKIDKLNKMDVYERREKEEKT